MSEVLYDINLPNRHNVVIPLEACNKDMSHSGMFVVRVGGSNVIFVRGLDFWSTTQYKGGILISFFEDYHLDHFKSMLRVEGSKIVYGRQSDVFNSHNEDCGHYLTISLDFTKFEDPTSSSNYLMGILGDMVDDTDSSLTNCHFKHFRVYSANIEHLDFIISNILLSKAIVTNVGLVLDIKMEDIDVALEMWREISRSL